KDLRSFKIDTLFSANADFDHTKFVESISFDINIIIGQHCSVDEVKNISNNSNFLKKVESLGN
ncbi:MAG: hypothetical protein MHPSP_000972, partial [Paramarteilia canceri]